MAKKVSEAQRSSARFVARVLPGAETAEKPGFVPPALPLAKASPPRGAGYVHEIRYDGLRLQAHLNDGRVAIYGRDGEDLTRKLAGIGAAVAKLPAHRLVLDGEALVQDARGMADAAALAADLAAGRHDRFVFIAFDLLHLDGFDIRAAPLTERKRVLKLLLDEAGGSIGYGEHLDVPGSEMLAHAKAMGLRGIVSKRADAPYPSGATKDWIVVGEAAPPVPAAPKAPAVAKVTTGGPLLVIDGDSFAHRAYHAVPKTIRRAGGKGGNAIVGFANYLLRFHDAEKPRAVVVGWDTLEVPMWRHKVLPGYQGGREFEDSIIDQLNVLPEFVTACGFANAKGAGYEADDFLAAAVAVEEKRGGTVLVASGDRDAFQLVSERTTVLHPMKGGVLARIGPAEVRERYGVDPKQVPDFIALRGDPSDRIPGAKGVGATGAANLLNRYPSLEAAIADGRFAAQADDLRLYRKVATMDAGPPLPALPDMAPTWDRAAELAAGWELKALSERLRKLAAG